MKALISFAVAFLINITIALSLAPNLVPFQCPEGGSGWMVFEDLDNNGYYDWVTIRECDGRVTEGPFPPPTGGNGVVVNVTTNPPAAIEFSYTICTGTNISSWEIVEKDGSGRVTAVISRNCSFSISVSYPSIVKPWQDQGFQPQNRTFENWVDGFISNNIIVSPNPSDMNSVRVSLSNPVIATGTLTVKVANNSGQIVSHSFTTSEVLSQGLLIDTSYMTAGTYSMVVVDAKNKIVAKGNLVVTH
jgi:hypothetical protein